MNIRSLFTCLAVSVLSLSDSLAWGQATDLLFQPTGVGNWDDTASWRDESGTDFGIPDTNQSEIAVINNGGTAVINSGDLIGGSGSTAVGPGNVRILDGTVQIQNGGRLTVDRNPANPNVNSSVLVDSTLNIQGTGVLNIGTASATGLVTFMDNGIYDRDITNGSSSPINVVGSAILGGTLDLDFSSFSNPGSYTLLDATAISGEFNSLNVTGLGADQGVSLGRVSGGTNGTQFVANVNNLLTLTINRTSGAATIKNSHGTAISLDAYAVQSAAGSLNVAGFDGLNRAGWSPSASNSTNSLAEVFEENNGSPSDNLGASSSNSIGGAVYSQAIPSEFLQDTEDVVFLYTDANAGTITGLVEYEGGGKIENNIVLAINPTTGAAEIGNTSIFPQQIDAYRITSSSGSLVSTAWNSLADNNVGGPFGWSESSGSNNNGLAEVNENGFTLFDSITETSGVATFEIGNIFNTAGSQDLVFEFLLEGENIPTTGAVVYGDLAIGPDFEGNGDFDLDGDVDGADFLSWQRGEVSNPPDAADLAVWQSNYGVGLGVSLAITAPVPEPGSAVLLTLAGLSLALLQHKKHRH